MADPYLILGVDQDADNATIETAYRTAIKHNPPEREPQRFQALREAYERIKTRRDRIAYDLLDTSPPDPLDILDRACPTADPGRPDSGQFAALLRRRS